MFLTAQTLGFLALGAYAVSTQMNSRRKILTWLIIYSSLSALQYILLGAWSGAASSVVPVIRNVTYRQYRTKKIPTKIIALFVILMSGLGVVFYDGPISLLPVLHTVIFTIFIGLGNLSRFRLVSILSSSLMFAYNFMVGAYIGVIMVAVQLISTIVAAVRFDRKFYQKIFRKLGGTRGR